MRTGELAPRQRRVLEAILGGATYAAAASAVGLTARTVYAWRKQPTFLRALQEGQDDILASSRGELRAAAGDSVRALREIVNRDSAPASARVRAALGILEHIHRTQELEELDARMRVIESELKEYGKPTLSRPAA